MNNDYMTTNDDDENVDDDNVDLTERSRSFLRLSARFPLFPLINFQRIW